jgi:hypothetical protein
MSGPLCAGQQPRQRPDDAALIGARSKPFVTMSDDIIGGQSAGAGAQ